VKKKAWCTIEISSGENVKIDREDQDRVAQHSWRATKGTQGRLRVVTSIRGEDGPRSVTLGKFLMRPRKGKQVYPRRFNEGLDYRKSNLVICDLKDRQRLLAKRRTKTSSPYRGVSYSSADGKWKAGIEVNGHAMNLGHFENEAIAAQAYNKAAAEYFGEMAYQNQIKKIPKRKSDKRKR
jgi:hypothetical protein